MNANWRRCFAALGLSACAASHAATTHQLDLAEMVAESDSIVIGRAVGAENVKLGRTMYTRYRIAVDESMLGAAGSAELSVVVPGGVDRSGPHPIRLSVVGAPVLAYNVPVALLLTRGGPLGAVDHQVVGFNQGVFALDTLAALDEPAAQVELGTAPALAARAVPRADRLRERLRQLVQARTAGAARMPQQQAPAGPRLPRGVDGLIGGGK